MKYLFLFLGLTSFSSAYACNVENSVLAEAKSYAASYTGRDGLQITNPQFENPVSKFASNGVEVFSVAMQYNDSCYGSVIVKIDETTCEIVGKTKINKGTCTDE